MKYNAVDAFNMINGSTFCLGNARGEKWDESVRIGSQYNQ